MPYLKADNPRAIAIHEEYQTTNDSKTFLKATREFLASAVSGGDSQAPAPAQAPTAPTESTTQTSAVQPPSNTSSTVQQPSEAPIPPVPAASTPIQSPIRPPAGYQHRPLTTTPTSNISATSNQSPSSFSLSHPMAFSSSASSPVPHNNPPSFHLPPTRQQHNLQPPPPPQGPGARQPGFPANLNPDHHTNLQQNNHRQQFEQEDHDQHFQPLSMMESLEQQLDRLMGGDGEDDDIILSTPSKPAPAPIGTPVNNASTRSRSGSGEDAASSFMSNLGASPPHSGMMHHAATPMQQQQQQQQQQSVAPPSSFMTPSSGNLLPPTPPTQTPPPPLPSQTQSPIPSSPVRSPVHRPQGQPQQVPQPAKTPRKELLQQKRLWTHTDEQPGRIMVHDMNIASPHVVLDVRPRQELGAKWMLSWKYLQQRAEEIAKKKFESADSDEDNDNRFQSSHFKSQDDNPLNRLLPNLRLGLFRRGCAENGAQASIISKAVMVSGGGRPPYLDAQSQMVIGTVPFYSPRTPGHVVFRMYWDDEPIYTLAVGPTLHVRVTEEDYEGTIRFLLSNLKKKVNPTSLSSLHSLALVLETPLQNAQQQSRGRHQQHQQQQSNDRAGRATWGCICEARKVLDACATEYAKTSQRLAKLATTVEELKAEEEAKKKEEEGTADEEQTTVTNDDNEVDSRFDDADDVDGEDSNGKKDQQQEEDELRTQTLREKTRALMSGRASCERKWRDSQLAFASILKVRIVHARGFFGP
jgi:hypothetical protein